MPHYMPSTMIPSAAKQTQAYPIAHILLPHWLIWAILTMSRLLFIHCWIGVRPFINPRKIPTRYKPYGSFDPGVPLQCLRIPCYNCSRRHYSVFWRLPAPWDFAAWKRGTRGLLMNRHRYCWTFAMRSACYPQAAVIITGTANRILHSVPDAMEIYMFPMRRSKICSVPHIYKTTKKQRRFAGYANLR